MRNGKLYGGVIPPDVNVLRVRDMELGEVSELKIIALTNHPVGKYAALHNHPSHLMDTPWHEAEPSYDKPVRPKKKHEVNQTYPACLPGPPLSVKYTGLVKPAIKVWTEKITGYSCMVIFQTSNYTLTFI